MEREDVNYLRSILLYGSVGVIALASMGTLLGSYYTVGQTEKVVLTRWGAVEGEIGPGLHFKAPWIDTVHRVPILEWTASYPKISAYSKDQQSAVLSISITYHVVNPTKLYTNYGGLDNYIQNRLSPNVPQAAENIFGKFDAITAVQDRTRLGVELGQALLPKLDLEAVAIDSIQLENIDFDDAYEANIKELMKATVKERTATAEKNQRITAADATAYETTAAAKAEAEATTVNGLAQASAIKARAEALKASQDLVKLTAVEKWDGKLPVTMLPGSVVPFIDLGK